ncbi:MAG: hypothetical protein FJ023_03835 [Chloroflexi bacterium]|nr:hypothetical protein [Chloroflexota bacterium]
MALLIRKLSDIFVSKLFAVVLISLLLFCLSIFPTANASAQNCYADWDITGMSGIKTNYQSGETISGSVSFKINNPPDVPACIQQILVGLVDSQNTVVDVKCIYDGVPKVCPQWTTGTVSVHWDNPGIPGTYRLRAMQDGNYSCSDAELNFRSKEANKTYKTIATITISGGPPPPPPPPPISEWLKAAVKKIQDSVAQIGQTISSIIQRIWHIIKTKVLPLAIVVIVAIVLWKIIGGRPPPRPSKRPYIPKWTFEAQGMENEKEFKIWDEIKYFRQRKSCKTEPDYQEELYRYLNRKFPNAEEQVLVGPQAKIDIKIDKIGIEIKVSTKASDFHKLRGQIHNYTFYFDLVYVVLFDPKFSDAQFDVLKTEILRDWPNGVGVITKPG